MPISARSHFAAPKKDAATEVEAAYLTRSAPFLDRLREERKPKESEPATERKPGQEDGSKPESEPPKQSLPKTVRSAPKPSDFVGQDFGKLGVGIEKPELDIHEIDGHAIRRMAERGVSLDDIFKTVNHPLIVLQQARGRVFYLSNKAAVVINPRGRVISTYSTSDFDSKIKALLEHVYE
jgi:hypothetical protein